MKELKQQESHQVIGGIVDDDEEKVYSSLTEVLNVIFMKTGISQFFMDQTKVKFIQKTEFQRKNQ